jgi:predicted phosphohydrolase
MKIQYCSDLHLEFAENWDYLKRSPIIPVGDILVIAGDLCYIEHLDSLKMKTFFQFLSDSFSAVYYIPGNHEFYGNTDISLLNKPLNIKILDNVFLVNNYIEKIDDVVLILSALWSHLYGRNIPVIKARLNDFHLIRYNEDCLSVEHYNQMHQDSVGFLKEALIECSSNDKVVVATHHLPSFDCIAPEFTGNAINLAFASNLNSLIESSSAQYWIYGHSHSNIPVKMIGKTKLISNSLGYICMNEHRLFKANAMICI